MEEIELFIECNQVLSFTVACLIGFVGFICAMKWMCGKVTVGALIGGIVLSPIFFAMVLFGLWLLVIVAPMIWYSESELRKRVKKALSKELF